MLLPLRDEGRYVDGADGHRRARLCAQPLRDPPVQLRRRRADGRLVAQVPHSLRELLDLPAQLQRGRQQRVGGELTVAAGQCVHTAAGEWVRYSSPGAEGAEYVAVCLPAFALETAHRD